MHGRSSILDRLNRAIDDLERRLGLNVARSFVVAFPDGDEAALEREIDKLRKDHDFQDGIDMCVCIRRFTSDPPEPPLAA